MNDEFAERIDKNNINPDIYRVKGEKSSLYSSLFLAYVILFILIGITLGIFLIIVLFSIVWIKIKQGQLLGHCIKISNEQLPDVYKATSVAGSRLSMGIPDVFVLQDPVINAYALGFWGRKSVILNSATLESMNNDELISILGHEFSHIKCGHTNWSIITGSVESVRIPIISDILHIIFLDWHRKTEYTCDRGSLLASRNLAASISSLGKVAVGKKLFEKLNIDAIFSQKKEVDKDKISNLSEALSTHPYILKRIHSLRSFSESDIYKRLAK